MVRDEKSCKGLLDTLWHAQRKNTRLQRLLRFFVKPLRCEETFLVCDKG